MICQKRILAARANGALSRGPKTPEGKARSRNALRSRRLTECTVLGNESREAFQDLFHFHVDCFSPLDDVEERFGQKLILHKSKTLRQQRLVCDNSYWPCPRRLYTPFG